MHYTNTFNEILYKQLFEENDTDKDEECCLITDDTLEEDHVKLVCNHKFNYIPLYKELSNQKNRNYLETSKLHTNQIKCPYCRTIQDGLIPFNKRYPELKKKGVNYPPSKYFKSNKCCKILSSGKRKGQPCNIGCFSEFCKKHSKPLFSNVKTQNKCDAILKSGKRKGEQCLKNCKDNTKCGIHNKI